MLAPGTYFLKLKNLLDNDITMKVVVGKANKALVVSAENGLTMMVGKHLVTSDLEVGQMPEIAQPAKAKMKRMMAEIMEIHPE